jgi:hypothetical protein
MGVCKEELAVPRSAHRSLRMYQWNLSGYCLGLLLRLRLLFCQVLRDLFYADVAL